MDELKRKYAEAQCRLMKTKKGSKCYNDTLRWIRNIEKKMISLGLK